MTENPQDEPRNDEEETAPAEPESAPETEAAAEPETEAAGEPQAEAAEPEPAEPEAVEPQAAEPEPEAAPAAAQAEAGPPAEPEPADHARHRRPLRIRQVHPDAPAAGHQSRLHRLPEDRRHGSARDQSAPSAPSFGVVLQDNFLFRGSIRDNILAGRPGLTLEDAVRAARLAGAEEFIERMPNGYET